MNLRHNAAIAALSTLLPLAAFAQQADTAKPVDFGADVRPLLAARCLDCHGPDQSKSGLRVDTRSSLLEGGDSGEPAIVPENSTGSRLLLAVRGEGDVARMPPKGERLTDSEIDTLRRWIDQGALMPEGTAAATGEAKPPLWSLQPLKVTPPPPADGSTTSNPIDAFVLSQLRNQNLAPSSSADPRTLLRRLHLVMLGLPPSPGDVDRFVADHDRDPEAAWDRAVDRVLARPEYGERWAQHWLDVIRWAETWGYETNSPRPDAWPYRDWLIHAWNSDLPYDQFAARQVAGDALGDDAATGFLVAGPANLPGQIGKDEASMRQARQDELDETVKTVSAAFLGLTVGCARCHDHKFDPIPQRDYHALQAVFTGLHYGTRRLRGPDDDDWNRRAAQAAANLVELRASLESRRSSLGLLPAITPDRQTETFEPVVARAVRFNIQATNDNSRPSLYEFEVWSSPSANSTPPLNVALASQGGRATSSSFALENQTRHPDNLIDGLWPEGGRYPWKARDPGPAWIQIDLPQPTRIDRVVWGRGFEGFPVDSTLEVQLADGTWSEVARSTRRMLHEQDRRPADKVVLDGVSQAETSALVALIAQARAVDAEQKRLAAGPQVFAGTFAEPEPAYRLQRGDPMQRREAVEPNIPAAAGSLDLPATSADVDRRLALARWLGHPSNALTARVIVNRLWQHHFGVGLVDTPSDFGRMGGQPSHPELLDWLAAELIRSNWSLKRIQRLILTSRTFRQSSAPRPEALAVDAESRFLWRFPPRRLDAEVIRDSVLAASGNLNPGGSGPGFDFFNQRGGLTDYHPRESDSPPTWRRMIYAVKVRMEPVDVFGQFDCPDAGQMAPRRPRSITPVQALGLLNSPFIDRQSRELAGSVRRDAGDDLQAQVCLAFSRVLGRPPTDPELAALEPLARDHGLDQVARVLFNANEFVFLP